MQARGRQREQIINDAGCMGGQRKRNCNLGKQGKQTHNRQRYEEKALMRRIMMMMNKMIEIVVRLSF